MGKKYYSHEDLVEALMGYTWRDEDERLIDDADEKRAWIEAWLPDIPSADVEPVKRGHWIEEDEYQICSECGEEHCWGDYRATYCDCCGAYMEGSAEE